MIAQLGGPSEKRPNKDIEKFFSNFQICHNQFFYLKTQHIGAWKLKKKRKKTLWSLFMDGVQLSQG